MSRSLTSRPRLTSGDRLAANRERFLTAEPVEPNQVRDTILASWWRSKDWKVAADRIDLSYVRDPEEALGTVRTAGANVAFLMNPCRMEQVRDIAFAGEVLPQKSTDFFPKLLSGLTIYALE